MMNRKEPKQRKCRCGEMYIQYTSFQDRCLACVAAKVKRERVASDNKAFKAKKAADRAWKKRAKEKDVAYQHALTTTTFNRMRVLEEKIWFMDRGIQPYCISCLKPDMDWSCGHFKTVGSQGNLRYDRMNTFLQCNYACNRSLSGNIDGNKASIGYKAGLVFRFGEEEGQRIIDYCETHTDKVKWDPVWLIQFRKECSAKIRELENL